VTRAVEGGFTIVEAVVAAAVLATALVSLALVIAVATTAVTRGRDTTRATLAAAQKLEELRAAGPLAGPVDGTDLVDGRYARRWTVRSLAEGAGVVLAVEVTPLARTIPPVRVETIRTWPGREVLP
jgi:type II secretory pathway pseudopilin PulG